MSLVIIGLPAAIALGIIESIAAYIRRPRASAYRHKAKSFGYYWDH